MYGDLVIDAREGHCQESSIAVKECGKYIAPKQGLWFLEGVYPALHLIWQEDR